MIDKTPEPVVEAFFSNWFGALTTD